MEYLKKEREVFNVDDFGHYKGGNDINNYEKVYQQRTEDILEVQH